MAALVRAGGLASLSEQVHSSLKLENPLSLETGFQRILCPNYVPFLGLPRLLSLLACPLTRQQCRWVCEECRDKPLWRQLQGQHPLYCS